MSSSSKQLQRKKSKGRQKVKIEKMSNQSNLLVTFSKRRTGFFKKANELSLLCGAEVGTIVFSPGKGVHSFGHPNVESVIGRFLNENPQAPSGVGQMIIEANRNYNINVLNQEVMKLEALVAQEMKVGEGIDLAKKEGQEQKCYPLSIEEFNFEELALFEEAILKFEKQFNDESKKATLIGQTQSSSPIGPSLMANKGNLYAPGFSFGVKTNSNNLLPFVFHDLSTGATNTPADNGENVTNGQGRFSGSSI